MRFDWREFSIVAPGFPGNVSGPEYFMLKNNKKL
jgi:hypothetical protein